MEKRSSFPAVALEMAQLAGMGAVVGAVISGGGGIWIGLALGAALAGVQGAERLVRRRASGLR